jgi:uncharacterized protein (TIGR02147 family)
MNLTEAPKQTPNEFLRVLYLEKKAKNSAYSTHALARDLGVSQAYVSQLLSGKRKLTVTQAVKVCALFSLTPEKTKELLNSILKTSTKKNQKLLRLLEDEGKSSGKTLFSELQADRFLTIANWYHVAILELSKTNDFKDSPQWLSERLGISILESRDAMERLIRLGFLVRKNTRLEKESDGIYFQTQKSEPAIRAFHKTMINKALLELEKTNPEDFEVREISSMTIPVDLKKIKLARQKIIAFQKELATLLSEGTSTEVFQFNVQLFPITKTKRRSK